MAAIWAALKSLGVLLDFIKWAAEFVRGLVVESKKQHAETTHDENQNAIDRAFDAPVGGVPDGAAGKPSAAASSAPAVPGSAGSGPGVV